MLRRLSLALLVLAAALLPGAAAAQAKQTLRLRFPRVDIPAGTSIEACVLIRVPTSTPFDLATWEIRNHGPKVGLGVLHFLVYVYSGEHLGEFAAEAGRVVQSRGCLDLGPADRDHRQLFATGAMPRVRGALPPGVALRLAPVPAAPGGSPDGLGVLLDGEWTNRTTRTRRASAVVLLRRARPRAVGRVAQPIFERSAELGLEVPPGTVRSTEDSTAALNAAHPGAPPVRDAWGAGITTLGGAAPTGDACVLVLTGHMHKHGRFLGIDLLGPDGLPANPPGGVPNPFETGRTHLFGAFDYTDPGVLGFSPPRLLPADEALHYACWHDNGVTTAVQLGCEESTGTAPGSAAGVSGGGPAKPCTSAASQSPECPAADAAYPTRTFTGACVPAKVVAGTTPSDEVCALAGAFYDPVPGAAPGAECNAAAVAPSR